MMTTPKRNFTLTTLSAALLVALPLTAAAGPQPGNDDRDQRRDSRIKIDARVQLDIPRQISREISDAMRDVAQGISEGIGDLGRDIGRDLGRDLGREFRNFKYSGHSDYQDRSKWRASLDDRQTKTISIGATGILELENFSGDITVVVGGSRDVSIEFVRSSHGKTEADARMGLDRVRPEVDVVGTRATVRATYMDRPTSYSVSTDFIVKAPVGTRIVVNSLRADVNITGIKGELKVTTASGDVVLTDVGTVQEAKTGAGDVVIRGSVSDGELDAGTLSGDITISNVKARRITANTVNGSVVVREAACEAAALSTISGDVVYGGSLARGGRYEFTSNSGDVRFSPTGSTGYAVEATSFTGEISSSVALTGAETGRSLTNQRGPRRRATTGKVGDGSATVTLQTFSGDITIGGKRQ